MLPIFQTFPNNPRGFLAVQWPDSASPLATLPPKWRPPVNAVRSGARQNWRARERRPLGRGSWGRKPRKKQRSNRQIQKKWLNMCETPGTENHQKTCFQLQGSCSETACKPQSQRESLPDIMSIWSGWNLGTRTCGCFSRWKFIYI